jgi:hypothetical protein
MTSARASSRKERSDRALLDYKTIGLQTPLRLAVAASLAYPDGLMTASGLGEKQNVVGLSSSERRASR